MCVCLHGVLIVHAMRTQQYGAPRLGEMHSPSVRVRACTFAESVQQSALSTSLRSALRLLHVHTRMCRVHLRFDAARVTSVRRNALQC